MSKNPSILLAAILFAGCSRWDPAQTKRFDSTVATALPICEQFFLPNSMARTPGIDINAYQSKLEHRIMSLAESFHSSAGRLYLQGRIERETDDVTKACVTALLAHARDAVEPAIEAEK